MNDLAIFQQNNDIRLKECTWDAQQFISEDSTQQNRLCTMRTSDAESVSNSSSTTRTYRAEAAHGGLDVLNEVGLVRIAALGLGDEKVGRLEAGLEPDVSLTAEEGLVPPCLAHFHGLMDPFLAGDKGLLGFGASG